MSIRSKKDSHDQNSNRVRVKIGQGEVLQDIISLTVFDNKDKEYSLKTLFEKILDLEVENATLKKSLKEYITIQKETDSLIVNAADLLSLKVSQLEQEISEIKEDK